jgi:hypothetical protein
MLWNPEVHYHVHKSLLWLAHVLDQMNSVHTLKPIRLRYILMLLLICISHISPACYIPHPSHPLWFDHSNTIWWSVQLWSFLNCSQWFYSCFFHVITILSIPIHLTFTIIVSSLLTLHKFSSGYSITNTQLSLQLLPKNTLTNIINLWWHAWNINIPYMTLSSPELCFHGNKLVSFLWKISWNVSLNWLLYWPILFYYFWNYFLYDCGLVVRVSGYRFGGPGSIPGATRFFLRSSGAGTGSTQPRDDNWGAISRK